MTEENNKFAENNKKLEGQVNKVIQNYIVSPATAKVQINSEAKSIADSVGLNDHIQQLAEKEAFITLKLIHSWKKM